MMSDHFKTHSPLWLFNYGIQKSNSAQSMLSTITNILLNSIFSPNTNVKLPF